MEGTKNFWPNWEKIFKYSVYFLLLIIPLIHFPFLNLSYELPKLVFFRVALLIMLAASLFIILKKKKMQVPVIMRLRSVRIAIALFLLTVIFGTIFSIAPLTSFYGNYYRMQGMYTLLHYFLLFLLLVINFDTEKKWDKGVLFLGTGFLITLIYGLLQSFGIDFSYVNLEEESLGRVFSGFGHPLYLANYLVLSGFIVAIISYEKFSHISRGWLAKFFIGLFLILFLYVLFATGTRSAIIGFGTGGIFFTTVCFLIFKKKKLLISFLILLGVLGAGIMTVNFYSDSDFVKQNDILSRFTLNEESTRSLKTRFILWDAGARMFYEKPFFGHGIETASLGIGKYLDKEILQYERLDSTPDKVHNSILDIGIAFGAMGIIAYLYGLIVIFITGIKGLLSSASNKIKLKITAVLAGILAIFISNIFGFSVTINYVIGVFLLAYLIFLCSQAQDYSAFVEKEFLDKGVFVNGSFTQRAGKILLILFVVTSILTENIFVFAADYYAAKGATALKADDLNGVITNFETANFLNPNQSYYKYLLGSAYLAAIGTGEDSSIDIPTILEKALLFIESAGDFSNQNDFYYHYLKGKILMRGDEKNLPLAEESFQKAYEIYSVYPALILDFARYYRIAGDCQKTLQKFDEYLSIIPNYWQNLETESGRLFYKHNPDFAVIFEEMQECR